ncbi:polyribonucleotide nucleotidyltransferase [Tanacetum coccineum]
MTLYKIEHLSTKGRIVQWKLNMWDQVVLTFMVQNTLFMVMCVDTNIEHMKLIDVEVQDEFENDNFIPDDLHDNEEDGLHIDDGKQKKRSKNRSTKNVVLDDDDCELIEESNLAFRRPTSESCKRLKKVVLTLVQDHCEITSLLYISSFFVRTKKSHDWLLASIRNEIVDAAGESAHTLCVGIFKVHRCILRVMGMEKLWVSVLKANGCYGLEEAHQVYEYQYRNMAFCSSTKNTGVSKKNGKGCVPDSTSHSVVEVEK